MTENNNKNKKERSGEKKIEKQKGQHSHCGRLQMRGRGPVFILMQIFVDFFFYGVDFASVCGGGGRMYELFSRFWVHCARTRRVGKFVFNLICI